MDPEADRYFRGVLGVPSNATPDQITERFQALAKIYHPDHSGTEATAAQFVKIRDAYMALTGREVPQEFRFGTPGGSITPSQGGKLARRELAMELSRRSMAALGAMSTQSKKIDVALTKPNQYLGGWAAPPWGPKKKRRAEE